MWICCDGCKDKLLASRDEYLAKLKNRVSKRWPANSSTLISASIVAARSLTTKRPTPCAACGSAGRPPRPATPTVVTLISFVRECHERFLSHGRASDATAHTQLEWLVLLALALTPVTVIEVVKLARQFVGRSNPSESSEASS